MSQLKIYNTLARDKQVFVPLQPGKINMYVCGMTVYDYCHVGHARMMMAFDVIYRWFKASGYEVKYVRNITDIDDKIIKRAVENGETMSSADHPLHQGDGRGHGRAGHPAARLRAARHRPRAAHAVDHREAGSQGPGLPGRGRRRELRRARIPGYGKLSGKSLDDLRAGERVDVNTGKRDPLDFVLWKAGKESEPAEAKWDSKWGIGRPGWHIECSAMSCALLGEHFDIHGGGADLQFPHHENEIAQSEGAFGAPMANYWIHNGFVRVDNEKMSKSLGNFFTIRDVLKKYDAEVVRFFILRAHYRSPLNYSDAHIDDAKGALTRLYTALADVDLGGEQPSRRLGRAARPPFPRSDGRRLQHAAGGGRAVRPGKRSQQEQVAQGRAPAEGPGRRAGPARALAAAIPAGRQASGRGRLGEARSRRHRPPRRRQEGAQFCRGRRIRAELTCGRHRPRRQARRHDQLASRMWQRKDNMGAAPDCPTFPRTGRRRRPSSCGATAS
jgi:cysteinyl-tRNA synthetase